MDEKGGEIVTDRDTNEQSSVRKINSERKSYVTVLSQIWRVIWCSGLNSSILPLKLIFLLEMPVPQNHSESLIMFVIAMLQEWNMPSVKSTFSNFGDVTKNYRCYVNENCITFPSKSFLFLHNGRSFGSLICCFSTEKRSLLVPSHSQSTIIIVPN